MKLYAREEVPGTQPRVYVGHRFYKDGTGNLVVSSRWHAEWNHNGRRHAEPLKTTNKAAAFRAAHRIVERIERGETRQVQGPVEWKDMQRKYIDYVRTEKRLAEKSIEKYEYVTQCFIDLMKERKVGRPTALTPADFWKYDVKMVDAALHPKTISDRLTIVKSWFKWASGMAKPKLLLVNPIADEEVDEAESSPQPCFTPQQVATLLANACHDHEAVIYAIMAYLGLRFGEVRDLQWEDFNFAQGKHGWVHVQRGGSNNRTKGKTSRRIPLPPELPPFLNRLPRRDGGRIFFQRPSKKYPNGDRPLDERRLLMSLKRLCKRCKFENPMQYKLHTFRHVFASMLARQNVSYEQALAWMGHKDSAILRLYITFFDPDAERAIKAVSYSATEAAA